MASGQTMEAIIADPQFEIITTLAYSQTLPVNPKASAQEQQAPLSNCYLLSYGIDRLRAAAIELSWPAALANLDRPGRVSSLSGEIEAHVQAEHPAAEPADRFIVRLALKRDGSMTIRSGPRPTVAAVPYFPLRLAGAAAADDGIPVVPVRLDWGTTTTSALTRHKTTWRGAYNAARARAGVAESSPFAMGEVLLRNEAGELTGGCFTTAYFWRGGRWVTPPAAGGCKIGVSRRWALEHAGVVEEAVAARDLEDGETVWLSSAVGGFCRGRVTLEAGGEGR